MELEKRMDKGWKKEEMIGKEEKEEMFYDYQVCLILFNVLFPSSFYKK